MREDPHKRAAAWQRQAERDLATARVLAEEDPASACYHAQQAAEKALKSLYVWHGVHFPYTHSTNELIRKAADRFPELASLKSQATELDMLALGARYPGWDDTEAPCDRYEAENARAAMAAAERIVAACQAQVGFSERQTEEH